VQSDTVKCIENPRSNLPIPRSGPEMNRIMDLNRGVSTNHGFTGPCAVGYVDIFRFR